MLSGAPKTGDGANFTLRWIKDGTSAALTTATVTEIDATNLPGLYSVGISATEADCGVGYLGGKSSTASVIICPVKIEFERLPNAVPGASGGVLIAGTNGGTISFPAATMQAFADELLKRNVSNVEATAALDTLATVVLASLHMSVSGTTMTIKRTDNTTTHTTRTLTKTAGDNPIRGVS
jgi:hypothetical protein